MKSPQEWVDEYAKGLPDSGFVNATEMIRKWISTIQQDAFESGRLSGLNEAGELCKSHEQTKTEYMIRLHNLIHQNSQIVVTPTGSGYNFGAKITVEPIPPATKSDAKVQK